MQFVFYILINGDSERIEIGETPHEREEYAPTSLYTGIVYTWFVIYKL